MGMTARHWRNGIQRLWCNCDERRGQQRNGRWVNRAIGIGDDGGNKVWRDNHPGQMRGWHNERQRDMQQPANAIRGGGATMGAKTSRQGKWEGGAMRGKVTMNWRIERRWQQQVDATTSRGKLEGGASRGNVITSRRIEKWWHNKRWCKDNQSNVTTSQHVEGQRPVKRWHKVA